MVSLTDLSPTASPPEILVYWIKSRWEILKRREAGFAKPWSDDPVFQKTYFCNVRREDDTVTKWIRNNWSQYVLSDNYELAMILARFVNWPETLNYIGFPHHFSPDRIRKCIDERMQKGYKTWGNAYVITTHGLPMGKAAYLVQNVLQGAYRALPAVRAAVRGPSSSPYSRGLEGAYNALIQLEGLGSFLAAQVVADLKNTKHHPLQTAKDWMSWCAPGPGSLRGMSWFFYGEPGLIKLSQWKDGIRKIRLYTETPMAEFGIPEFCNQDLQNCLCEFDKYMRVKNGTGRSKRGYNGI
jgi:hypothetical protein